MTNFHNYEEWGQTNWNHRWKIAIASAQQRQKPVVGRHPFHITSFYICTYIYARLLFFICSIKKTKTKTIISSLENGALKITSFFVYVFYFSCMRMRPSYSLKQKKKGRKNEFAHRNKRWRKYARSHSSDIWIYVMSGGKRLSTPQPHDHKRRRKSRISCVFLFLFFVFRIYFGFMLHTHASWIHLCLVLYFLFCFVRWPACAVAPPLLFIHSEKLNYQRGGFNPYTYFGLACILYSLVATRDQREKWRKIWTADRVGSQYPQ